MRVFTVDLPYPTSPTIMLRPVHISPYTAHRPLPGHYHARRTLSLLLGVVDLCDLPWAFCDLYLVDP